MVETSILNQVVEDIENAFSNSVECDDSELCLDELTMQLPVSSLTLLSGYTPQKNTIFASNLIFQSVFRRGKVCGVFCSDVKEFAKGQLSLVSQIDIERMHSGRFRDSNWTHLVHALSIMKDAPLFLERLPSRFQLLKDSIRNFARQCDVDHNGSKEALAFIFDLHQLIDGSVSMGQVLEGLKELAVEVGLPVTVIYDADAINPKAEVASFSQYADVVLSLEPSSDENDCCDSLVGYVKNIPLFIKAELRFDSERFTVESKVVQRQRSRAELL
jgi:replicative DNA helicase